jgi:hypothetical protein
VANARTGNTWYIDTAGTVVSTTGKNLSVTHAFYTSGSTLVFVDISDGSVRKMIMAIPTDNTTQFFDFSANPIVFKTSINVTAITNGILMLVVQEG